MAGEPLASGSNYQKRLSPIISPQQFAEETRQILDSFVRRHLTDTQIGVSYGSSGSYLSEGNEVFLSAAPVSALRKRRESPCPRPRSSANHSSVRFDENGQERMDDAIALPREYRVYGGRETESMPSSSSSDNERDRQEASHNRGFDAEQSSSSSAKGSKERPRQKKNAFKRAKERLKRSFSRKTPESNAKRRKRGEIKRKSSSPMSSRRIVAAPAPIFQRSKSMGVSKNPSTESEYLPRRRRFLQRLRRLGRRSKQELPPSGNGGKAPQSPRMERPLHFPRALRQLGDSLSELRERITGSPRRVRKDFVDYTKISPQEEHIATTTTSTTTINIQRPSTSGASRENSVNVTGVAPMTPSTFFATLSLVANSSQSSSQKSSQQSRQASFDGDIYAQIATRLGQLGDEYVYGAIEAARLQQEEVVGCVLDKSCDKLTDLERDVINWAQSTNGLEIDRPEGLEELTQATTVNEFGRAIERAVTRRARAPATQLALVFHFTSAAIRTVGATSGAARRLGDYCVSYVGNRFADWLIEQGGWMSVVEDASTTSCSEVD